MGTFKIEGGHQLKGAITPQGAKNEALQILCAVLLTPEEVTIENIPDIVDVNKLITLLSNLGVKHSYSEFPVGHGVAPQNFYELKDWLKERI